MKSRRLIGPHTSRAVWGVYLSSWKSMTTWRPQTLWAGSFQYSGTACSKEGGNGAPVPVCGACTPTRIWVGVTPGTFWPSVEHLALMGPVVPEVADEPDVPEVPVLDVPPVVPLLPPTPVVPPTGVVPVVPPMPVTPLVAPPVPPPVVPSALPPSAVVPLCCCCLSASYCSCFRPQAAESAATLRKATRTVEGRRGIGLLQGVGGERGLGQAVRTARAKRARRGSGGVGTSGSLCVIQASPRSTTTPSRASHHCVDGTRDRGANAAGRIATGRGAGWVWGWGTTGAVCGPGA